MSSRLPPIESLRVLEACVRHANFTRAAAELAVTPAAVSLRMRDLEAHLGVELFKRSGPRLTPTAAGVELAAGVREGLAVIRSTTDKVRAAAPLRVTAPPTFAVRWLAPRLGQFCEAPGGVTVKLDASPEIRDPEDFDVAVRTGLGTWPALDARPLMPVDAVPMMSPRLARTAKLARPADLAALPLLPHPDWRRWFEEAGASEVRLRFCAGDYATHELDAAAAIGGQGVALLSPVLFAGLLTSGELVQPFSHVLRGPEAHFIVRRPRAAPNAVKRFCAWLSKEAGAG